MNKIFVKKYKRLSIFDNDETQLRLWAHGFILTNENNFIVFRHKEMVSFILDLKNNFNIKNQKIIKTNIFI